MHTCKCKKVTYFTTSLLYLEIAKRTVPAIQAMYACPSCTKSTTIDTNKRHSENFKIYTQPYQVFTARIPNSNDWPLEVKRGRNPAPFHRSRMLMYYSREVRHPLPLPLCACVCYRKRLHDFSTKVHLHSIQLPSINVSLKY